MSLLGQNPLGGKKAKQKRRRGIPSEADAIRRAALYGYTLVDGQILSTKNQPLKIARVGTQRYPKVTVYIPGNDGSVIRVNVLAHRLMAFLHFGEVALLPGTHVRHLDGNAANCTPNNLGLGDASTNMLDKDPETRRASARVARSARRGTLSEDQVRTLRAAPSDQIPHLAAQYGVSPRAAMNAATGRTHRTQP